VTSLASTVKPITSKGYVSALRSFHIENGWNDSAFTDLRLDFLFKGAKRLYGEGKHIQRLHSLVGAKRLYGEGKHLQRLPLTEDLVKRLLFRIPSDCDGLKLRAALCVGSARFLYSGEFTWEVEIPMYPRCGSSLGNVSGLPTAQSNSLYLPQGQIPSPSAPTSISQYPLPICAPLRPVAVLHRKGT